ncbi:hypothetical protein P43SY_001809 [Pythium insidiosum]|uniref:Uncharacterized protein n=1 Tax=Pythium insidiosum TaxID=114742 RepID=A0AAD5MEP5_PYTIN|nr:hypothetical protein P43SY_001809 [Pythium insidiosum]
MNQPRPKTLKRTISKCGIDAVFQSDPNAVVATAAAKKVAGLPGPHAQDRQVPRPADNQRTAHSMEVAAPRAVERCGYSEERPPVPTHALGVVDESEPVLLPRHDRLFADELLDDLEGFTADEDTGEEPEWSPTSMLPLGGWDDSPLAVNQRYYESLLESTTALVSPSPQHILYPNSHDSDYSMDGSTVSMDLSTRSSHGALMSRDSSIDSFMPLDMAAALPLDRESLSPANLRALLLEYLSDVLTYYHRAKTYTFEMLAHHVRSVPWAFRYIQGIVRHRFGIAWHLVGQFIEHALDFISDEDIREATLLEFAGFLRDMQDRAMERVPAGNIFGNLYVFFQNVLADFKKYLVTTWLATKRIEFPCEFGKKSSVLFLCMECHREHL